MKAFIRIDTKDLQLPERDELLIATDKIINIELDMNNDPEQTHPLYCIYIYFVEGTCLVLRSPEAEKILKVWKGLCWDLV